MIRDILVHIPTERPVQPIVEGSVSLAAAFGAHLDALALGYVSPSTAYIMEGSAAVASVFEMERERAEERAGAALGIFEAEAKGAGISYSRRSVASIPAEAAELIGAAARVCDLAVVLQPESERDTFDNVIPREILFQAGGPVLFIPHIFRGAFKAKRIGICWDGSRLAARALRDAAPFLSRADAVVALAINPETAPDVASASKLAAHLARAGRSIRIVESTSAHADIQPAMLSLAADEELDLLVMGGYGHSRLQETVLGGVTREMLQAMTVPTLMSH